MRASEITENVDKACHPFADQLAEELEWQAARLKESREAIKNAPIVMTYDNGGGQKGIRRNPMFDAYEALFASFCKGVAALDAVLAENPPTSESGNDALNELRLMVSKRIKIAN